MPAACDGTGDAHDDAPVLELGSDAEREAAEALRLAERLVAARADTEAAAQLRIALEKDPRNLHARLLLARVLVSARKDEEAVTELRAYLERRPRDEEAWSLLGTTLHVLGRLDEAEQAFRKLVELAGRDADAWYGLGRVLYAKADYDGAVQAFSRAERWRASRADIRSELGLALLAQGHPEQSEAKQRDVLERDPNYVIAHVRLGDAILAQSDARADEAVAAFTAAVDLAPRDAVAALQLYRGLRIAAAHGNETAAGESDRRFRRVLELHEHVQMPPGTGAPHRAPRDVDAAERTLREALAAAPDDLALRRRLAELLHAAGHADEAVAEYEAVLAGGVRDTALLAAAGAAHLASGRLERAVELLGEAVQFPDVTPLARRLHAWALLRADRRDEAQAACERLLAADPSDRLVHAIHGLALVRADRLDEGLTEIAAAGWLR